MEVGYSHTPCLKNLIKIRQVYLLNVCSNAICVYVFVTAYLLFDLLIFFSQKLAFDH